MTICCAPFECSLLPKARELVLGLCFALMPLWRSEDAGSEKDFDDFLRTVCHQHNHVFVCAGFYS